MNKFLVGSAALFSVVGSLVMAGPASAQSPGYNWTGFYAGANLGYSWGESKTTQTLTGGAVAFSGSSTFDMNGAVGGVQLGYNWQAPGPWIFGVETDFQWTGQDGNTTAVCPAVLGSCLSGFTTSIPNSLNISHDLNWFGTLRARLGVNVTPTLFLYGTGGLAYGQIDWNASVNGITPGGVVTTVSFNGSDTKTGWVVGVGAEGVIAGNWTAKIEYLYIDFGTVGANGLSAAPIVIGGVAATYGFNSRITDNIVRVGLNYKFGG